MRSIYFKYRRRLYEYFTKYYTKNQNNETSFQFTLRLGITYSNRI